MADGYGRFGLYNDPADPRLFVPKRIPMMGWTINLGHPRGRATLNGLFVVIAVFLAITMALGLMARR